MSTRPNRRSQEITGRRKAGTSSDKTSRNREALLSRVHEAAKEVGVFAINSTFCKNGALFVDVTKGGKKKIKIQVCNNKQTFTKRLEAAKNKLG